MQITIHNTTDRSKADKLVALLIREARDCYAGFGFGACPVGGSLDIVATWTNDEVPVGAATDLVLGILCDALLKAAS